MLPRNTKTLYAVIGRPPSLAGLVQLTFMEVASMSTLTGGEPGASEVEQNRTLKSVHMTSQGYGVGFRVGRLYACTNQGTVWVTFRVRNRLRKVVHLQASFCVIN